MAATDTLAAERADQARSAAASSQARTAKGLAELGLESTYTVQPGDTYETIAAATGGDPDAIYDRNAGVASTDPTILEAGTVLTIPTPTVADAGEPDEDVGATVADERATIAGGERVGVTGHRALADVNTYELEAELERRRGGSSSDEDDEPSLAGMTRAELDAEARRAGVADPDELPNKDAVREAIEKARR